MIKSLKSRRTPILLASSIISLSVAQNAVAQQNNGAAAPSAQEAEAIVVVGTQIKGAKTTEALPVTVVDANQIAATGAVSGDELLRNIPQMGDVGFNSTNGAVSSNFARGDIGSINLRNLGVGNTLVLLNGRRLVQHPGSQAENSVPVITYNSNALPVAGLDRVEVLLDGAAAIYGTDAVAGVVNTVLRNDVEGGHLQVQYGGAEGTSMRELQLSGLAGHNFNEGRGNFTLSFSYLDRAALKSTDQDFTSTGDKRDLFADTSLAGRISLDQRNTLSPWGDFQLVGGPGSVTSNGTAVTNASGQFHIQPGTNSGCQLSLGNGICIDDGNRATGGADRNLRSDGPRNYGLSILPSLKRLNLFATSRYDLTDDLSFFTETGYYLAQTRSVQESAFSIGSIRMTIPASNYWNPFGPVTFADGTVNPNRLPGLNIPEEGLPVTLVNYRPSDVGPSLVKVENTQLRLLAGLRGKALGFDWEIAGLYSEAKVTDKQTGQISATAFQNQLGLSTPDAYNPFNGGDIDNPTGLDGTPSNAAAIGAISTVAVRKGKTTLALADFKASRPDLFNLPAGGVGLAFGAEVRRDTQLDDRDDRVDGTITWLNTVTGVTEESDLWGISPTPDTRGARTVASAFAELAIPVVSPDMNIPLVRRFDLQLAGRYEHYSDFGSVAKPKVAAAWDVVDGLRFRGSYSEGFRAPNLEQMNATVITRGNNRVDYIRCEADVRAGRGWGNCASDHSSVATARRAGNPDLKAETSTNWTVGTVIQPRFIPSRFGRITFTADYWQIRQKGIVGVFGEGNALILDYLLRTQGSSNPLVTRRDPTQDDIDRFAGTGLDPVGSVEYVDDQYVNLDPQEARGLDLSLNWQLRDTGIGDFNLALNAAHLIRLNRKPSPAMAALLAAREAGQINAGTAISEVGNLVRQDGRPSWRFSGALSWSLNGWSAGLFTQYIGSVENSATATRDADGNPWVVDSQITANLYVQYEFGEGALQGTAIRVGARNITDEKPPLASGTYSYLASLYQPYARYWYASIRKSF